MKPFARIRVSHVKDPVDLAAREMRALATIYFVKFITKSLPVIWATDSLNWGACGRVTIHPLVIVSTK